MEISAIMGGEGVRRLMANAIKNFHNFFKDLMIALGVISNSPMQF